MMSFWVFDILRIQFVPFIIVRLLAIVDEEIDAGGQKVRGGCLEELIAAATRTFLTFLQGFNQGFCRLLSCCQVADVFLLDGVYPTAILYIYEVDDSKLAS